MKICPITYTYNSKFCRVPFKPSNFSPKTCKFWQNWRNFAKSGPTAVTSPIKDALSRAGEPVCSV